MQSEFQPEENQTPQTAYLPVAQTTTATATEMEAQAARFVTERLNELTRRARRVNCLFKVCGYAFFCSLPLAITLMTFPATPSNPSGSPAGGALLIGGIISLCLGTCFQCFASLDFDERETVRLGGTQAIVPLFALLDVTEWTAQIKSIYRTLATLLPQMKASDAHLLTPNARRHIHKWFTTTGSTSDRARYPDSLRFAALKALEQVGDSRDIPAVERLANMMSRTPADAKVKQAAIDCLPMLRARCGTVEAARTLLRASHAQDAQPDTLLRPASGAGLTVAQVLLRGAEKP